MATELLLALMKNKILDSENKWILHQNYETDEIYRNLVDSIDDYRKNNEMICKLQKHVKEFRSRNNSIIDSLESEVFQISLNTEQTFSKILGLVEQIKSKSEVITNFDFDDFILKNSFNDIFIQVFEQLYKIIINLKLEINLNDNEWIIMKNKDILAKTKTLKSKIQLLILKYPENIQNFDPTYEEFKDKKISIELNDNHKIWSIILKRLS